MLILLTGKTTNISKELGKLKGRVFLKERYGDRIIIESSFTRLRQPQRKVSPIQIGKKRSLS